MPDLFDFTQKCSISNNRTYTTSQLYVYTATHITVNIQLQHLPLILNFFPLQQTTEFLSTQFDKVYYFKNIKSFCHIRFSP